MFRRHLGNDHGMNSCVSYAALFFKRIGEKLSGLCATYVDDTLYAGDLKYSQLTKSTESKIRCKPREWNNIQFAGVQIRKTKSGFEVHQTSYIEKLGEIPEEANYSNYRSLRAKLAWSANTRPDICCSVAKIAQITEERFEKNKKSLTKDINKIVKHLKIIYPLPLNFLN